VEGLASSRQEGIPGMKIPLKMGQDGVAASKAAKAKVLERDILAARKGDWKAKNDLIHQFMPLISSLAEKRASDPATINRYIEAGKNGLMTALRKYKTSVGGDRFQIFALDFIERAMDNMAKGGGFFARLLRLFG
jgi:DNA-directed RNA polymerase specialized sigma subunit